MALIAGGHYPERLSSKSDIQSANKATGHIDIWNLPIQDYPLLGKFTRVYEIDLDSREGAFATDEKLKALAALNLTNLNEIVLNNCRLITDAGISWLSKIRPLRGLGLEGTEITDKACETMASQMRLTGVDIANCNGVTLKGIKVLAASDTLRELAFSADKLSQEEVLRLVASFRKVAWCQIVDPQHKLDAKVIKAAGQEKKIHIVVKRTGALQDKYGTPD